MHEKLRKYLKKLIEDLVGLQVCFEIASAEHFYPYLVFDMKEWAVQDINRHIIELTIDAWDRNTPKKIIWAIDQLDKHFRQYKDNTEDFVIQIYNGSARQFIPDEDKDIRRLQRRYDIVVYEKGDLS